MGFDGTRVIGQGAVRGYLPQMSAVLDAHRTSLAQSFRVLAHQRVIHCILLIEYQLSIRMRILATALREFSRQCLENLPTAILQTVSAKSRTRLVRPTRRQQRLCTVVANSRGMETCVPKVAFQRHKC
jgi:hypothetical protein